MTIEEKKKRPSHLANTLRFLLRQKHQPINNTDSAPVFRVTNFKTLLWFCMIYVLLSQLWFFWCKKGNDMINIQWFFILPNIKAHTEYTCQVTMEKSSPPKIIFLFHKITQFSLKYGSQQRSNGKQHLKIQTTKNGEKENTHQPSESERETKNKKNKERKWEWNQRCRKENIDGIKEIKVCLWWMNDVTNMFSVVASERIKKIADNTSKTKGCVQWFFYSLLCAIWWREYGILFAFSVFVCQYFARMAMIAWEKGAEKMCFSFFHSHNELTFFFLFHFSFVIFFVAGTKHTRGEQQACHVYCVQSFLNLHSFLPYSIHYRTHTHTSLHSFSIFSCFGSFFIGSLFSIPCRLTCKPLCYTCSLHRQAIKKMEVYWNYVRIHRL